jgi:predicted DNA-binding transcriptional regulator YafY
VLEPYTLVVYKKGLYLAGYSHHHGKVRTFSFDGFRKIDRLKKDHPAYPKEYPSQLFEGAFGMIGGERTRVRLLFDANVGRFVRRRLWHPTLEDGSRGRDGDGSRGHHGAEDVDFGWADEVEVLAPNGLRREVAEEVGRVWNTYLRR